MRIQYKDFDTVEELLIDKINEFIKNNSIKVINIESIYYINRYKTRLWYYDYK